MQALYLVFDIGRTLLNGFGVFGAFQMFAVFCFVVLAVRVAILRFGKR